MESSCQPLNHERNEFVRVKITGSFCLVNRNRVDVAVVALENLDKLETEISVLGTLPFLLINKIATFNLPSVWVSTCSAGQQLTFCTTDVPYQPMPIPNRYRKSGNDRDLARIVDMNLARVIEVQQVHRHIPFYEFGTDNPSRCHPVVAPSLALRASLAYLASTPCCTRSGGFTHLACRSDNSLSLTFSVSVLASASMVMLSPS